MFSQVGASERADHDDAQSRGSSYLERSFYQRLADVPSTEWLGNLRVNQGERLVSPFVREICGVAVNGQLKPLQRRVVRYEHVWHVSWNTFAQAAGRLIESSGISAGGGNRTHTTLLGSRDFKLCAPLHNLSECEDFLGNTRAHVGLSIAK